MQSSWPASSFRQCKKVLYVKLAGISGALSLNLSPATHSCKQYQSSWTTAIRENGHHRSKCLRCPNIKPRHQQPQWMMSSWTRMCFWTKPSLAKRRNTSSSGTSRSARLLPLDLPSGSALASPTLMFPNPVASVSCGTLLVSESPSLHYGFCSNWDFSWFYFVDLVFQQLEIDYVIGESYRELLPSSTGPAAIIRVFGVTREGFIFICFLFLFLYWVTGSLLMFC